MSRFPIESWIWLDPEVYPANQKTALSCMSGEDRAGLDPYTVARFRRCYRFGKPIHSVSIRTSGDTFFRLYVNGCHAVTGPASVGGDFLGNALARPHFYATEVTLDKTFPGLSDGTLDLSAVVRMQSVRMFEYSMGHGGFFLTAHVRMADGTQTVVLTDERWEAQHLPSYTGATSFDNSIPTPPPSPAVRLPNRWHCLTSPIPPCTEREYRLTDKPITVPAGENYTVTLPLDRIYTGYVAVNVRSADALTLELCCRETESGGPQTVERLTFVRADNYRSSYLTSAGRVQITAHNTGTQDAVFTPSFVLSHYPVETEAKTETDDTELNRVLDVCAHTLKYCRQTLHLDSGSHCEPLACTGDYYIEALMTSMTFGDMRLAAFDVRRTAELLRYNDGRMFHTSYSLIWVQMLFDVYRRTAEEELLRDCEDALTLLLARFATYLGENGLIENPPDYMFVDWLDPDGISLHHPPKALGQTCLNLFYYGALRTAEMIYRILGEDAMAQDCLSRTEALRTQILALLYDRERGLFFEGLNTPTPTHLLGHWMPQNVEKRYYRRHANILAVYFSLLPRPESQALLRRTLADDTLGVQQPYFAHFLLEAIYRCGLRDEYTRSVLEEWKAPIRECPLGLAEGFYKPEPSYQFDHSHAWGGTPCYALPLALSGLTILAPGYKKVALSPSLLGLNHARVEIPTPYGMLVVEQHAGEPPQITAPDGMEVIVE